MHRKFFCLAVALIMLPMSAHAHTGITGSAGGFASGFLHPMSGLDHVLAMLAVGMWGSQLGNRSRWVLPVAFPMVMSLGGIAGMLGLPLPAVELGIALSVIVLGAMIAFDQRPGLPIATALVALFAVFHGYAHGAELPTQAGVVAYCAGFVIATSLIHLAGIAIGLIGPLPRGLEVLRSGGAAIAVSGLYLAVWQVFSG